MWAIFGSIVIIVLLTGILDKLRRIDEHLIVVSELLRKSQDSK